MKIVTDRGADLLPEHAAQADVRFAPLAITLDGKTYLSGIDIQPDEFYRKLDETGAFPLHRSLRRATSRRCIEKLPRPTGRYSPYTYPPD